MPSHTIGVGSIRTEMLSKVFLGNENNTEYSFTVSNLVGQIVFDGKISSYSHQSIDLSQFSKGVYSIEFTNNSQTYSKKVVIE